MDIDKDNVRPVLEQDEDRLSRLRDELLGRILSCFEMKFVGQMCLLSTRWKLVWTSMPCLNFSSGQFCGDLCKFDEFVTKVLYHRKDQVRVSSVKIHFDNEASQVIVRKIAKYAFSHNVQQLTVYVVGWAGLASWARGNHQEYELPPCLLSSQSLKKLSFRSRLLPFSTPTTPWDFPALTTLHLSNIVLCHKTTKESLDLFSKSVDLKILTLSHFDLMGVEVFDIITPRLSNLILINGRDLNVVNVIAPQLENLTIIDTRIRCQWRFSTPAIV